ncbi:MAG: hypothetical protein Q8L15_14695 [Methylobacter sp.]|nr:hypothetical protein [Methylobacter sp.]
MSICDTCKFEYDESQTACVHCGLPANFPNVFAANKSEQTGAIDNEYGEVIRKVSPGVGSILSDFEATVRLESQTVLVRPLAEVLNFFDRSNNFHQTFHQRLRAGAVGFDGGEYDKNRPAVDGKLFPNYHEMITFAALNLKETGATGSYGKCHMVLKPSMTDYRATVFKGNSYEILKYLGEGEAKPVPLGLRTTWKRRGKLAVLKFAPKFTVATTKAEYPAILNDGDNDFIEVHVYGSISHRTIKKVSVVQSSLDDIEKLIAEALKMKIANWANTDPKWDTIFMEI